MKPRIAVLCSGSGTTVKAFIRAGQRGAITATVELVICSRKDAGVFQKIADLNSEFGLKIETALINSKTHPWTAGETELRGHQTAAEEAAILEIIEKGDYDLIALMGYMKRTGPRLVKTFGWRKDYVSMYQARMVNTHPGLLPETKGMHGEQIQRHVLENHLPSGGQTLHVVAEDYDDGPIIAEHAVAVEPDDTVDSLFSRVQLIEKHYLPLDIEQFIVARTSYSKTRIES